MENFNVIGSEFAFDLLWEKLFLDKKSHRSPLVSVVVIQLSTIENAKCNLPTTVKNKVIRYKIYVVIAASVQ